MQSTLKLIARSELWLNRCPNTIYIIEEVLVQNWVFSVVIDCYCVFTDRALLQVAYTTQIILNTQLCRNMVLLMYQCPTLSFKCVCGAHIVHMVAY